MPKRVIEDFKIFIKQVEHEYDYTFPLNDEGFPQLAFPEWSTAKMWKWARGAYLLNWYNCEEKNLEEEDPDAIAEELSQDDSPEWRVLALCAI